MGDFRYDPASDELLRLESGEVASHQVLVELIRGRDGVHLWVETDDDFGDLELISEQISSAIIGGLELDPAGSEVHPP